MKKILLPITTIVGASIATLPSLVSCGGKATSSTFDYDLTKIAEWTPSIQPTEEEVGVGEITAFYLNSIKNNPKIAADDFIYIYGTTYATIYTNVSISILDSNPNESLFSVKIKWSSETMSFEAIVKNIPFSVYYHTYTEEAPVNCWMFENTLDEEYLLNDEKWYYYDKTEIQGGETTINEYNKEIISEHQENIPFLLALITMYTTWPPYYLSLVPAPSK